MPNASPASTPDWPELFAVALTHLWPNGDEKIPGLRAGMIAAAPEVFTRYLSTFGLTSPLLVAHVMAQFSHECGAGHDVVENLSYSAQRMTEVWPTRFPTLSSAYPYARNPAALGNKVYDGRMGNRPGSGDGYNFRGRGGSQCTGRDGYARLAKATGLDLINNPDLVIDPKNFLLCSVADFVACGCLDYARADDVVGVSAMLNVGHLVPPEKIVGLAERRQWLSRWKAALGAAPFDLPHLPPATPSRTTIAPKPAPPMPAPPPKPAIPAAATNSIWSFVAALFAAIFKRKG